MAMHATINDLQLRKIAIEERANKLGITAGQMAYIVGNLVYEHLVYMSKPQSLKTHRVINPFKVR